jgi:pimeloyl-ACP methyl ester carboxylesterase
VSPKVWDVRYRRGDPIVSAAPDNLQELVDRFDRDSFDMPKGRARVRLCVGDEAWDLEVQRNRHRFIEARTGSDPDTEIRADAATWTKAAGDLQGGMAAFRAGRLTIRRNLHLGVGFLAATSGKQGPDALRFETIKTECGRVSTMSAGTGKPIIMLHGLGATKAEFLPTLAALAPNGWRVIAIDLPGYGDSDKPFPAAYDAAFFSRWVVATLDALGIDRAHVLGHSMGGRVALEVGMSAPDRTDRLIAMTPSMAWLGKPGWAPMLKLVRPELGILQPAPKGFVEGIVRRVVPGSENHYVAPALDEFMRSYLSPRGRVAFYASARNIALENPEPFWGRLQDLSPESLFIWGRRDTLVPIKFANHVRRTLPAATHVELECGHVPQLECPRKVHGAIERFLQGKPQPHGVRSRGAAPVRRAAGTA